RGGRLLLLAPPPRDLVRNLPDPRALVQSGVRVCGSAEPRQGVLLFGGSLRGRRDHDPRSVGARGCARECRLHASPGAAIRQAFARSNPGAILGLFVVSLLAAAVIGAAVGYLAAYPALRLRGDFLAIVLIAVGEAGRVFGRNYEPLAGGVFGLPGVPNPFAWLPARADYAAYAILVLAIAAGMYLFAVRLSNSPFGRLLKSIRDDELAASVYGKDAPRAKGHILAIGSGMAAVAGALYVFYVQQVYADDFIPLISFAAVTMVILGGVANHKGTLVGAAFMTLVDFVTRPVFLAILGINWQPPFDLNYVRYLVTGLIIVLVLLF